jgi:hypothetical protein
MTSTNVPNIDAILAAFPEAAVPIEHSPDNTSLRALKGRLKRNAAFIPSNQGGGNHGHLGLILSDATYNIIAPDTPFNTPPNPGPTALYAEDATGPQIAAAERLHKTRLEEFIRTRNVADSLKRQLLATVPDIYLAALKNPHVGYANVSTRALLDHLFENYGVLHSLDLMANNAKMSEQWDPSTPFETLSQRIDECIEIADDAGRPYQPLQILDIVYALVFTTGLYTDELKEWDRKPAAEKSWATFKPFIFTAQTALNRQRTVSAGRQGYGHLAFEHSPTADDLNKENCISDALALLATATTTDRTAFQAITSSNQMLTQQLATAMQRLTDLETKLGSKPSTTTRSSRPLPKNKNYCWTHGWILGDAHTGSTCKFKAEGHKDAATRENPLGGSSKGKQRATDFQ